MCVIAWSWDANQQTLLLLSNRDEFYARPALPAHWWEDNKVLAGRDQQAGGTWLGLSRDGRLAALTNYRMPQPDPSERPSRGALVADFLHSELDADRYLQSVAMRADSYQPFNLLVFDGKKLMGLESRHKRIFTQAPGLGAVSNADFDTPWPKLVNLKQGLKDTLNASTLALNSSLNIYLPLLQNAQRAAPHALPDTGIDPALELALSSIFIAQPGYGTRASSVVCITPNKASMLEQSYEPLGQAQLLHFSFDLHNIHP